MDKLDIIFELQEELNKKIGISTESLIKDKQHWILNFSRALGQELSELIDSTAWKWWSKYQTFDEQNAKVEVIDILHFTICLCLTLGLTSEDVMRIYKQKHNKNIDRQNSGYEVKDKNDCKHIN